MDESAPRESDSDETAFYNDEEEGENEAQGPRIPLIEREDEEGEDLYGELMER